MTLKLFTISRVDITELDYHSFNAIYSLQQFEIHALEYLTCYLQ